MKKKKLSDIERKEMFELYRREENLLEQHKLLIDIYFQVKGARYSYLQTAREEVEKTEKILSKLHFLELRYMKYGAE